MLEFQSAFPRGFGQSRPTPDVLTMDKIAGYKKGEADNDNLTGIDGPLRMWLAPLDNGASVPIKIAADSKKIGDVTLTARKLSFEPLVTTEAAAGQDVAGN